MVRKKLLAYCFVCALMVNPINVFAAEKSVMETDIVSSDYSTEGLPVTFNADVEIKQQIPVEITNFPSAVSNVEAIYKVGNQLNLQSAELIDVPVTYDVVAGRVEDVLTGTGELKVLALTINPGVYLQAQLTQPSYSNIDYNLYILDSEGYILTGSEYSTRINGTFGTLPESVGYITSGTEAATYYLAVLSSNGGSANETFKLEYSVSNVYDRLEPSENAMFALPFTFGTSGSYIDITSLSSPIDNDWYILQIPEDRIYDELTMNITTGSTNVCCFEVYQNVSSSGYEMVRLASSTSQTTVSVSTGNYYIRVCNSKTMEEYNENDIQNYTFTIIPKLRADSIYVTEYDGNEGVNHFVQYPGYSRAYFRTTDWIKVTGYVAATDKETGELYGVSGHSVTAVYANPYWEANNTPDFATRTGMDVSDGTGLYSIEISLPIAMGVQTYNNGISTQYFDLCGFEVMLTEQPSIRYEDTIVHFKYSLYN